MTMTDFTSTLRSRVSAFAENARDLTLDFEAVSGSRFFDNDDTTMKEVQTLLNSRLDREKLEALRRLVALMSRGTDVSSYFASVIQLIASPNLEIKKLVYIYLLRYAESNPDLALMSINTIQKSLSDKNQIVRGMALRVMSGIKVPLISGIVILGIRKCITDLSYFVRKTSAIAIIKCYDLDPRLKGDLIPLLHTLLRDKVPSVLSCALSAWEHVCPERTDLLHQSYRQICRVLIEMDEWGQLVAMRVLTVYVRRCFDKPVEESIENSHAEQFYDDASNNTSTLDPDLQLLYKCALQLIHSRSSAVVIALARLFQDLAPTSYLPRLIPYLIRLLRARSPSLLYPILSSIAVIASQNPMIFTPHLRQFYLKPSDPTHIALLKLDILVSSITDATLLPILRELNHYSKCGNAEIASEAIRSIARCAMNCTNNKAIDKCVGILGRGVRSRNDVLSTSATLALRTLIQSNPDGSAKYVHLLSQSLGDIHSSPAKAEIIWLVGEFASQLGGRAADILRLSLQDFAEQDDEVKYQIITLAAKVYALYFPTSPTDVDTLDSHLKQIYLMYTHAISLARYDVSYDLRDRMRLLKNVPLSLFHEATIHTQKPVSRIKTLGERSAGWMLGSTAQVIARDMQGQFTLPEWGSEVPEQGVRDIDSSQSKPVATAGSSTTALSPPEERKKKKVWRDLDKFYASESEEESEEDTDGETEEEATEGSEGQDDEDSDAEEEETDEEERTEGLDLDYSHR